MGAVICRRGRRSRQHRKEQLLSNILLYSMTAALACTSFCSTHHLLIYLTPPPLFCCLNIFISLSITHIASVLLTPKFLFIVGNLIVLFLVGNFKMDCGDYLNRDPCLNNDLYCQSSRVSDTEERGETDEEEEEEDVDGGERTAEETVELNKRAADFIARVNYQIRVDDYYFNNPA